MGRRQGGVWREAGGKEGGERWGGEEVKKKKTHRAGRMFIRNTG